MLSKILHLRVSFGHLGRRACALMLAGACLGAMAQSDDSATQQQQQQQDSRSVDAGTRSTTSDPAIGPVQLRQSSAPAPQPRADRPAVAAAPATPLPQSEFERYVQSQSDGTQGTLRRFGADLMTNAWVGDASLDPLPVPPGDYVINPGDEIQLTLWGSVDADLRVTVDRSGSISVPRIGAIQVAGIHYADLTDVVRRRVARVFKNFELSVTMGRLRSIRVFVAGYARHPGSLTVSSLSSVLHVLMRAGGPTPAGSLRDISLQRNGKVIANFDFYRLLLTGDRSADLVVQPDDVVYIGPAGPQVGILGSVNQPGVFELRPGENFADVVRMAGGFTPVADRDRATIERLRDRYAGRVSEVRLDASRPMEVATGDLIRIFSTVAVALPKDRQNRRVHIEGEVVHPGDYVLPPGTTLQDAVRTAGGLTSSAFVFGTELTRVSVLQTQQANYDRALRQLETDIAASSANHHASTADEVAAQRAADDSNRRLLDSLRAVHPTGRLVLQTTPASVELPPMEVFDGDRIAIPARATSVGVFGSVFNPGSFVYSPSTHVSDYLQEAGGPTRGADTDNSFIIRANGSVVSARQTDAGFWSRNRFDDSTIIAGDAVFVPEEVNKATFVQNAKDWSLVLYQLGLGLAGLATLHR